MPEAKVMNIESPLLGKSIEISKTKGQLPWETLW